MEDQKELLLPPDLNEDGPSDGVCFTACVRVFARASVHMHVSWQYTASHTVPRHMRASHS